MDNNISCMIYREYFNKYSNYMTQKSNAEEKEYFRQLYFNYMKMCLTK